MDWNATCETVYRHLDSNMYSKLLLWVYTFIAVCTSGPMLYVIILHSSFMFVLFYRYWYNVKEPLEGKDWNGARDVVATIWDVLGRVWHGYEIVGLENITSNPGKAALLVSYHGPIAIDIQYLLSRIWCLYRRPVKMVLDRFLFKIPGWKLGMEVCSGFSGEYEKCVQHLKEGHLMVVLPGGSREGLFGDESYTLLWKKRTGFARLALEAKVPVIPIFTQNIREAFRVVGFVRGFLRPFYEKTRIPFLPVYGGLPVKMRTYVGETIEYDPKLTPEQLAKKTASALERLIAKHQTVPGSLLSAVQDRFDNSRKIKD